MRILIVKISAMGDVLHALPVLDYLHQTVPGCEIDWVVESAFADLLRHNPMISRLHCVNFKKWKRSPFSGKTARQVLAARKALLERSYDLVIDIQGNIKSGLVAWLSGCPRRIGFSRKFTQESLNVLLTSQRVTPLPEDYHITDQYLRVASAPFGGQFDVARLKAGLAAGPEDDAAAAELLALHAACRPLLLFHTGTTWQTKFWHEAGWIELGKDIKKQYPGALMLFSWGNDQEYHSALRIAEALGDAALVLERLALTRLIAIVRLVDLVVGGDTGIVHLAAAAGTPTVSYYRSSDGLRSGPRGASHMVVQAPMPCARCFRTSCEKDRECRESITPLVLAAAVSKLIEQAGFKGMGA